MKIGETKKLLRLWLEGEIDVSIFLLGGMGIGKSWIPKELAKELGVGYDGIFPSQMGDGSEMTGTPYRENSWQRWSRPENIPSLSKEYKCRLCIYDNVKHTHEKGFYVVDEINTAPIDIRNSMMEFMLSGSIHRNKIEGNWVRIACGNPETEGFQVESLSKALTRRMVVIKLVPDFSSWEKLAKDNIDKEILRFLESNREFLFKEEPFNIETECNPDSYRMLTEIKKKLPWEKLLKDTQFEIIQGLCGKEAATSMITFFEDIRKPMTPQELFKSYDTNKSIFLSQKNDLLAASMKKLLEYIQNTKNITKEIALNICDFVTLLNKEYKVVFNQEVLLDTQKAIHSFACNIEGCNPQDLLDTINQKTLDEVGLPIKKYLNNPWTNFIKMKHEVMSLELELENITKAKEKLDETKV